MISLWLNPVDSSSQQTSNTLLFLSSFTPHNLGDKTFTSTYICSKKIGHDVMWSLLQLSNISDIKIHIWSALRPRHHAANMHQPLNSLHKCTRIVVHFIVFTANGLMYSYVAYVHRITYAYYVILHKCMLHCHFPFFRNYRKLHIRDDVVDNGCTVELKWLCFLR